MTNTTHLSSEYKPQSEEGRAVAARFSYLYEAQGSLAQVEDMYFSYSPLTANHTTSTPEAIRFTAEAPVAVPTHERVALTDTVPSHTAPEAGAYDREATIAEKQQLVEEAF